MPHPQILNSVEEYCAETVTEQIQYLAVRALAHLRQGDLGAAKATADKVVGMLAPTAPTLHALLDAYSIVAEIYLTLWETSGLKAYAVLSQSACRAMRTYARVFTIGRPHAFLWQGLYYWLNGKKQSAFRCWRRSLEEADRLEMRYVSGLAHYEIGRHMALQSRERHDHLSKACCVFKEIGVVYDQKRVEALLFKERATTA